MKQSVKILGTRGSIPINGSAFKHYGGATVCVVARLAGQVVVLDAGTGILRLPDVLAKEEREFPLLLSHPHVDHLLGLPMCPAVFVAQNRIHIYAVPRHGINAREQLQALMSPPLWPVCPEQLPAKLTFHDLPDTLYLGPVTVEAMEGVHPGGVTLLRLTGGGRRVVYITDSTLTEALLPRLMEFARNCDLLLCDGQYREEELPTRQHFGHSTWTAAARFGAACGAKSVRILHHDPSRRDNELDAAATALTAIHPNCAFARAGEEIEL